jgi:hypothetical protein
LTGTEEIEVAEHRQRQDDVQRAAEHGWPLSSRPRPARLVGLGATPK